MIVLNFMVLMKDHNPIILWSYSIIYSILVLITRSHYSVDIFLAYIITISIYMNIEYNKYLFTPTVIKS